MSRQMVFHLPYDFGNLQSGSRVHPYKMYQAFLRLGYQVDLMAGDVGTRRKAFANVRTDRKDYAFCYSEPASYPVHPFLDYSIYLYLKRRGIPIGIFYADAYWRFPDYFNVRGIKRAELLLRYKSDLWLYNRVASALFFPSSSFADTFDTRISKVILPPGGENRVDTERDLSQPVRAIYVGGITYRYGFDLLLRCFGLINQSRQAVLELVCRKQELDTASNDIRRLLDSPWLNIHHISGEALEALYGTVHIGVVPIRRDAYNDMAMPVKLFEYLSFGLPVVVTDCPEMSRFVKKNGCGLVCKDDAQSLAKSIRLLISDRDLYKRLSRSAMRTILQDNLWEDRARTVVHVLSGEGLI